MRKLMQLLGLPVGRRNTERSELQERVEAQIEEIQEPRRKLEELLEAEPTGFVLGDAILGRREREQWTQRS